MPTTLVAGATGYLGRYIVAELHRRGHMVRAIVRDRGRAAVEGAYGAPSLDGLVDDWAVGNVTDSAFTQDVAAGVDHVVSALGVTRQKADPWSIDNRANQSILASALRHGTSSFTYINALGAETCPAELTRAKTAFARALESADIRSTVINPSAYFSDAAELLTMAKRGFVPPLRAGHTPQPHSWCRPRGLHRGPAGTGKHRILRHWRAGYFYLEGTSHHSFSGGG